MNGASSPTLAVAGLVTGVLVGLTGMGGGALLTPFLVVILGVPPGTAVGSDIMLSLLIKPFGASVHARSGTVRGDLVGWLALGSVPAAFVGAVSVHLLGKRAGAGTLQAFIGVALLAAAGAQILRSRMTVTIGDLAPRVRPGVTVAIGVFGGLMVGVTSVGSGSLMLVLLGLAYPSLSGASLVGTDIAQAIPLVAAATLGHLLFGNPSFALVSWLLVGAIPGVLFGSRLGVRIPDRSIRLALVAVLASSGLKLVGLI